MYGLDDGDKNGARLYEEKLSQSQNLRGAAAMYLIASKRCLSAMPGKGPFKEFTDAALWDYICGGFVQEGGHVRLACRPEWEQYTYVAQCHNLKKGD